MCNKSITCGVLFASGAITFYEGNNILSAMAKYVMNRLIHGLFHISLVISPRLISSLGADIKGNMKKAMYLNNIIKKKLVERANMGHGSL